MANIVIPNLEGTQSKAGWTEDRNRALTEWAQKRSQVKILARVYQPSRATIRHALVEVDEWIRDYGYEPENLKSELRFKPCFFDFELDPSYRPDVVCELPDQCEVTDTKANKAFSAIPSGAPFLPDGKILKA